MSLDPLGLAAGAGVGGEVTVLTSGITNFFELIPAQAVRGVGMNSELTVVRAGPFANRVVCTYTDKAPSGAAPGPGNVLDVRSFFSDTALATFSLPIQANDFGFGDQFMSSVQYDRTLGTLHHMWYDTRDNATHATVRRYATASYDGGATWLPNLQVSDASSNGALIDGNQYLDYCGVDAIGGCAFGAWFDNSNSTGDNPGGAGSTEIYVSRYAIR
jgi:hypothetical protein